MQGLHLTADLHRCAGAGLLLTDAQALRRLCLDAVRRSALTVVADVFHRFDPNGGVTGVVLLAESHLAVHTWPELAAVTLDVYVCNYGGDNSARAEALMAALEAAFAPGHAQRQRLRRGALYPGDPLASRQQAPGTASPHNPVHPNPPTAAMHHLALTVINDEHLALAAMLRSLSMLLKQARREGKMPPFDVLRAMMFYIDAYPERLHHPKESELLFPLLRERAPELAPVLDRLDKDHDHGERNIRELEHLLLAFEVMGDGPHRQAFEDATERYIGAYLEHMGVEEREVMPAARRLFSEGDWEKLDAAFAANRDPLTGHEPADEYRRLFTTIVNRAPAPVGLG